MNWSYWEQESFIKKPDVIVIGSGIVGLNASLQLKSKHPALQVLVLERGALPYGASTRNAGFACFGSISELISDLKNNSWQDVFDLVQKRFEGLQQLRNIIGDSNLDYEPFGGYEIFTPNQSSLADNCLAEIEPFNKELEKITGHKNTYSLVKNQISQFGFENVDCMIKNSEEGQINTGKMMKVLLEKCRQAGVEILNGIKVLKIIQNNHTVQLILDNNFNLESRKVLIATNGFARELLPEFDVAPARAQVLITQPIAGLKIKGSFHYDEGYYYFRNVGNRILFGGGRNLAFNDENTSEFGLTQLIQNTLEKLLKEMILPKTGFLVDQRWSGIMGLGKHKNPIIKKVNENIYCCVRMGGMGIALGAKVGEESADLILSEL